MCLEDRSCVFKGHHARHCERRAPECCWIGLTGFSALLSAVLASVGGLYTSVVVKYTDNIMKGFSAAAAIVLSTVASVVLFGLQISECIAQSRSLLISWCIHSQGQKVYTPPQNVNYFTKIRGIMQNAC